MTVPWIYKLSETININFIQIQKLIVFVVDPVKWWRIKENAFDLSLFSSCMVHKMNNLNCILDAAYWTSNTLFLIKHTNMKCRKQFSQIEHESVHRMHISPINRKINPKIINNWDRLRPIKNMAKCQVYDWKSQNL